MLNKWKNSVNFHKKSISKFQNIEIFSLNETESSFLKLTDIVFFITRTMD